MGYLGTEDTTTISGHLTAIQGTLDDNNNQLCILSSARGGRLNKYFVPHHRRALRMKADPRELRAYAVDE